MGLDKIFTVIAEVNEEDAVIVDCTVLKELICLFSLRDAGPKL